MSEKVSNEGRKKGGFRNYLKAVLDKLSEGFYFSQLDDRNVKNGIPHTTLSEILNLLSESNIIYKDENGRYHYYWEKERKEIMNKFFHPYTQEDYDKKLNHCRMLFEVRKPADSLETEKIINEMHDARIKEEKSSDPIGWQTVWSPRLSDRLCLIQHLYSGYPQIYRVFNRWSRTKQISDKGFEKFQDEVKRKAEEEYGFKVYKEPVEFKHPEDVKNAVWRLPKAVENCIQNDLLVDIKVEGDNVMVYGTPVSQDKTIMDDLRNFFKKSVDMQNEDAPIKYYTDYDARLKQLEYDYIELNYHIGKLAHSIKHGDVLRGSCESCPKVSRSDIEG